MTDETELELARRHATIDFGLFQEIEEPDSIKKQWWRWHKLNPHVYELFKRFTLDVIRRGRKQYSSKAIVERIRWHTEVETVGEEFKMNNNYAPYYARLFMKEYPEHANFFRTRSLHSENDPMAGVPQPARLGRSAI